MRRDPMAYWPPVRPPEGYDGCSCLDCVRAGRVPGYAPTDVPDDEGNAARWAARSWTEAA